MKARGGRSGGAAARLEGLGEVFVGAQDVFAEPVFEEPHDVHGGCHAAAEDLVCVFGDFGLQGLMLERVGMPTGVGGFGHELLLTGEVIFRVENQLIHHGGELLRLAAGEHGLMQFVDEIDELAVLAADLFHVELESGVPFDEPPKSLRS